MHRGAPRIRLNLVYASDRFRGARVVPRHGARGRRERVSSQHEAPRWRERTAALSCGTAQWMETRMVMQRRRVSYRWHLRERMTEHGIATARELRSLLAERGVGLSLAQVHRTIATPPARLSLRLLAALCDILDVEPGGLIETSADAVVRPATPQDKPAQVGGRGMPRPVRTTVRHP